MYYGLLTRAGAGRSFRPDQMRDWLPDHAVVVMFAAHRRSDLAGAVYYQGVQIGSLIVLGPEGIVPFTLHTGHALTLVGDRYRLKLWLTDTQTFECWLTSHVYQQFLDALKTMQQEAGE